MTNRIGGAITLLLLAGCSGLAAAKLPLDPDAIPKFSDPLPVPTTLGPTEPQHFQLGAYQVEQQVLPAGFPKTAVWAYGAMQQSAAYPGPTIEVEHGMAVGITWANALPTRQLLTRSDDTTDEPPPRTSAHLHGSQQTYLSNGGPSQWATPGTSLDTRHANNDAPGTFWYHDNATEHGELNRYAGLLGMYIVRDPQVEKTWNLPSGPFEIPLIIEDKDFFDDGSLLTTAAASDNTKGYGNVILVNGKSWPHLDVAQHRYRFRILNAARQRFFKLGIETPPGVLKPKLYQIGADGGYFKRPLGISSVLLGPGEIADLIVDFVGYRAGLQFELSNTATTPYPNGMAASNATGRVMQFRMLPSGTESLLAADLENLQDKVLTPAEPPPALDIPVRSFLVREHADEQASVLVDSASVERQDLQLPMGTEVWEMINPTQQVRVLHVNSMHFRLLSRQAFRATPYLTALHVAGLGSVDQAGVATPALAPYLLSDRTPASGGELIWKPTVRINPGEVTRFVARWSPDEQPRPPLDTLAAMQALEQSLSFTANWPASFRVNDASITTAVQTGTERRVTMAADVRLLDTQRIGH
jgi:spore coat protein A, manganese oxidase